MLQVWGNFQLKADAYELKEKEIILREQVMKKKVRNGRAQNIQGQRHTMVWSPETSMH